MSEPITVGYWAIRGLASPLRMMVMFSGRPLNNVMYEITETDGKFGREKWLNAKPGLKEKNPLMNLPYVIDGNRVITQSNACYSYLGRQLNLWGINEDEVIQCEEYLCEVMDIRNNLMGVYGANSNDGLLAISKGAGNSFNKMEAVLEGNVAKGQSGTFLVGDHATAPDFHLYEMLLQYSALELHVSSTPTVIDASRFPRLSFFYSSFQALPANAKYLDSNIGTLGPNRMPFNNKMAFFGPTPRGEKWVMGTAYEYQRENGTY